MVVIILPSCFHLNFLEKNQTQIEIRDFSNRTQVILNITGVSTLKNGKCFAPLHENFWEIVRRFRTRYYSNYTIAVLVLAYNGHTFQIL